ncbi:AraC family transcriptional regulator [Egicoccus sp. AB-alg2]|uniref:helix-turn-helix transcriptional regulator n=1 Tax=Egicoccus sp. AB-alg2 TaxID=3242693 RepID=UPI00359D6CCC
MTGPPVPEIRRIEIDTADREVAHGFIRDHYGEHTAAPPRRDEPFRYRSVVVDVGAARVSWLTYAGDATSAWTFEDLALVGVLADGGHAIDFGRGHTVQRPGLPFLLPPLDELRLQWQGPRLTAYTVPLGLLEHVGADVPGSERGLLRFTAPHPTTPSAARHLLAALRYLHHLAGEPELLGSPLVTAQASRLLATAILQAFPNRALVREADDDGLATTAAVRRATAYIEVNADRDLTIGDIARAAGVGVRSLQRAFQRHHGTSPSGYLRRVRLDRAHQDLRLADPGTGATVAGIAARWGFSNPGRFAGAYLHAYGQPPSHTLHR